MSDLEDFEFSNQDPLEEDSEEGPEPTGGSPRRQALWVMLIILLVAIVAVAVYLGFFRRRPETVSPATAEEASPTASRVAEVSAEDLEPELELPELDASDAIVRELVAGLSSHPTLASWLVTEDLVRRFVAAVDNVADGETPRTHMLFVAPREGFQMEERDGSYFIDPRGYRRYDLVTEVLVSLDTVGTIELYRKLKPLIQSAYQDLGYPNRNFDGTLERALRVLLETPRVEGEIELEPAVRSFHFADSRLEGLLPVQKQLLRFGPRNLDRVQSKLELLQLELVRPATGAPG
jgi:hypothetical protein